METDRYGASALGGVDPPHRTRHHSTHFPGSQRTHASASSRYVAEKLVVRDFSAARVWSMMFLHPWQTCASLYFYCALTHPLLSPSIR
jgi:hypothetical protein